MIEVGGHKIIATAHRNLADLPWEAYGVDVVIEATGRFRTRAEAAKHLEAGASKVIHSAPAKGDEPADANIVLGVNDDVYDPTLHHIVTNASCTTNCLAPVAMVLHETVRIKHELMTTIHAYIVKSPYSAIFDAPLTCVIDETQVKVVAWYDNEWGYANRLVELAALVLEPAGP